MVRGGTIMSSRAYFPAERAQAVGATFENIRGALRVYHATGALNEEDLESLVDELSVLLLRLERVRSLGGDFASIDISSQLAWLCHHVADQKGINIC
jgi:hypothetical protein